ncbi:MAG: alpha/beta fold hydrolase [Candidatus Tectimicrobiota bacterium]
MSSFGRVVPSSDGTPIHYDVYGSGAPALVFVHGWCCNRSYWDKQVKHFAQRYTVVLLDLAGHGASGRQRHAYTLPLFGQDVVAVVEHLDLHQVVLIGHSMGGPVIVEAARCLPTRLLGLIGADTWWDIAQQRSPAQVAERLAPFRADFVEAAQRFVCSMFVPTSDPALVEHVLASMSAAPPQVGVQALEAVTAGDQLLRDGFSELQVPRLTINAEGWRPTNLAAARAYQLEVQFMPGVGHFVMLEDAPTFNRLLDAALSRWTGAR